MKSIFILILSVFYLTGCASNELRVVADMTKVKDMEKFKYDKEQCIKIAKEIDFSNEATAKTLGGAALGAGAVSGAAALVYGAVFLPAIPFIIAGGLAGGGLGESSVSEEQEDARNSILSQCMTDRGYKVYTPK